MINKDMLQCLLSIELNTTEISKSINAGRALVARWIEFHQSSNVFRELENDNEITELLSEMQKNHPSVRHRHAVGNILAKGTKAKQARLRFILKNLKNSQHIDMEVVGRRVHRSRIANAIWHLDSTRKLVKCEFVVSSAEVET